MANANTVAFIPKLPYATGQGATSTVEFQFKDSTGTAAYVTVPADILKKRMFRIRAGGRVTGGTTNNFTAKLYVGAAINTALFTTGAIAVNSTSGSWFIQAEGGVDLTGDLIVATGTGGVNALMTAVAVATAVADPETALSFSASGTFSGSNSGNVAYMDYFEIDLL